MLTQKSPTESSSSPLRITRRRVSRIIPFGYEVSEENDKLLIEIPEHMELLKKAKKFIENHCSYKETAEWLSHHSGRTITGMGLREVLKRVINKGW
jgi:hypothetical protein